MSNMATEQVSLPLTAEDRCDRCGAQAYLKVEIGGSSLLFCAHHSREHEPKLRAAGARFVRDERAALNDVGHSDA